MDSALLYKQHLPTDVTTAEAMNARRYVDHKVGSDQSLYSWTSYIR